MSSELIPRQGQTPLRIGYMVPEFPSQTHAFFWREISFLRQFGCEVLLLSTFDPGEGACRHAFGKAARAETIYLLPPSMVDLLRLVARPRSLIATLRYASSLSETSMIKWLSLLAAGAAAVRFNTFCRQNKLAHVHVHSCGNSAHIAALARRFGGPTYSLTLHGDLPVYGDDHAQKMTSARFVSVVTSPLRHQVLEEIHLEPCKVPIITMGVDTHKFTPKVDYETKGPIRMITVARLNRSKGHRYVLKAMRKALDAGIDLRYTIVGSGEYRTKIETTLNELDLADRVTLAGIVSEESVRDLLWDSDIFLLTSFGLGEAAPVSVMEAMACGLPVICSRIGGTSDMICDGQDGLLVEQRDVEGICEALITFASSADYRRKLGQVARNKAEAAFDFRNTSRRLLDQITAAI